MAPSIVVPLSVKLLSTNVVPSGSVSENMRFEAGIFPVFSSVIV
ncbi:hypothetical protein DJ51_5566 [Bacillus cereus]|nr:hypothetical protein DJ51_5566 [Bacillus cereus]